MGAHEESMIPAGKAGSSEGKKNNQRKEDRMLEAGEGLTEWGGGNDRPWLQVGKQCSEADWGKP